MTVNYEIDGAVGVVTLAKPPHNLLDDALLKDLMTAYVRHFCAGMDDLPSWKWISVSVPPTCARNSTRSIAENWPSKPIRVSTSRASGLLTVTCGGGIAAEEV